MPKISVLGVNLSADVSTIPKHLPGTVVEDRGRTYMYAMRLSVSAHNISTLCSLEITTSASIMLYRMIGGTPQLIGFRVNSHDMSTAGPDNIYGWYKRQAKEVSISTTASAFVVQTGAITHLDLVTE